MIRPYILCALLWAAVIFTFSTRPETPPGWYLFPFQDKVFHFFAYAVLALLIHRVFLHAPERIPALRAAVYAASIAIAYGAALEMYQFFLPARDCSAADFIANCAGASTLALHVRRSDG